MGNLLGAVLKATMVSVLCGACVVAVMNYMGIPVPSAVDLLRGVSRLANILS